MFEECYLELIAKPKYAPIREQFASDVSKVHNGYFSQDKKGRLKDTKGDTAADDDTYNTIMRDKEWLLSFACPLRFIFSHSALKEGWDNPNVFQVCTLIEQKSVFTCRQKVGRGLRLCVNQDGERVEDKNINILHVMANESFSEFAETLQREIEEDTGMKFGVLQLDLFAGMVYEENGVEKRLSYDDAQELLAHFEKKGYITSAGKIKDTMKNAVRTGTLDLPKKFEAARKRFEQIITKADKKPPIRDASRDVVVRLKKQVTESPEFLELWQRIKQKTIYRVDINTDQLVDNCVKAIQNMPAIPKARIISQTADIRIEKTGISHVERGMRTTDIADAYQSLPDIITAISDATLLTPTTVNTILVRSGRLKDFLNNPETFLEKTIELIRNNRHALAIAGISYIKLDGKEYYVQEIFDSNELIANLDHNAVAVDHSVYDYVVYDSGTVEKPFALVLDNDPDVKMFFKIPDRFKIDTPIGSYNPDWAVYLTKNGEEKLYFVLETKGSESFMDLRTREQLKIHCGKRHFDALESGAEMQIATNWSEIRARM